MEPGTGADHESLDRGLRDIFLLHRTLMSEFRPETDSPELNRTHWRTLMYIAESGPDCMKGICRHVGLEAGSFTPVADRLIKKGFLERYQDPNDRRRILLRLTSSGESAGNDLRDSLSAHFSRRLSVLDEKELTDLTAALNTIRLVNTKLQGSRSE